MKTGRLLLVLAFLAALPLQAAEKPRKSNPRLGFDRNEYPGDEQMRELRKVFSFSGYWLNRPPGATEPGTTWTGKRKFMTSLGYGFLVLYQGRLFSELKATLDPAALGKADALAAIAAAQAEGFPRNTIIFLGHEEGGRLLPQQRLYLHAWIDAVNRSPYRAGVYCSGIPFREDAGEWVTTAQDIKKHAGRRRIQYWVFNDACPPSPGCFTDRSPRPRESGIDFALVWQFAQSPKRKPISAACSGAYRTDGNCYPPEMDVFVDINSSTNSDPSHGRSRR
jgi:hypothetical protein